MVRGQVGNLMSGSGDLLVDGNPLSDAKLCQVHQPPNHQSVRILTLPPVVPKGQNMNSCGRQPTVKRQNTFDPAGVARFECTPPWVYTHGYSCLAACGLNPRGSVKMRPI